MTATKAAAGPCGGCQDGPAEKPDEAAASVAVPCRIVGLTVRYRHRTALDEVTLDVPANSITAVIGGDGAGKTTLLRAAAGLVRPAVGRIERPAARAIGFVSGTTGVYRDLTVTENLEFVARAYGIGRGSADAGQDLLERIGLARFRDSLASHLSGGMRQKLAVALALLHKPKLLLLDEATTGVDPVSRAELWRIFTGAAAGGAAVMVATTYLDEAERAAWVCLLEHGRQLLSGPPEALLDRVRGRMYAAPARSGRPAWTASWRDGATWRLWAPDGPPGSPPDVAPAEAVLADAAIVAMMTAGERPPRVAGTDPVAAPADAGRTEGARPPAGPDSRFDAAQRRRPAATVAGRPAEVLVEGRRLVRRFGSLAAVDDVDITVSPGEIVGLLGANGAGKTTLIRLLLGLLLPDGGEVRLLGAPPSRRTRSAVGYVPQGLGLWDDLTVRENLFFATAAFGGRRPDGLDPDLETARDVLVRDLPLGLRRRLAFTAALGHDPRLLVLDEPTSGVDPLARTRLWETVHRVAAGGAGVLVTTHYMAEATQCDRLVFMAQGRVALAGTTADILQGRTAVQVDAADWAKAFAVLEAAGLQVSLSGRSLRIAAHDVTAVARLLADRGIAADCRPVPASLEEIFVAIAGGPGRRAYEAGAGDGASP